MKRRLRLLGTAAASTIMAGGLMIAPPLTATATTLGTAASVTSTDPSVAQDATSHCKPKHSGKYWKWHGKHYGKGHWDHKHYNKDKKYWYWHHHYGDKKYCY
jgi:hypothetical protein